MTSTLALFDMPRLPELVVILVIALLVFGRRLPDVARSVGRSINEFKKGLRQVGEESTAEVEGGSASAPVKPLVTKPAEGMVAKEPANAGAARADALEQRAS